MIVSANQPYFFPYPGFFYKAHHSDIFVILDTVQFPRGTTWITRNRFKNHQGSLWMTLPVRKKGLGLQNQYCQDMPRRTMGEKTFEKLEKCLCKRSVF
jgi:hypothetical protein